MVKQNRIYLFILLFYLSIFLVFFLVLPLINIHGYSFGFIPFFFFFPFFFGRNRSKNNNTPASSRPPGNGESEMDETNRKKTKGSSDADTSGYEVAYMDSRKPDRYRWLYLVGIVIIVVGIILLFLRLGI